MTHVVLVAGARRGYRTGVPAMVHEMAQAGAPVHLVSYAAAPAVEAQAASVVVVPGPSGRGWNPPGPLRLVAQLARAVLRRRAVDHFRRGALRSPQVAALLSGDAVLVALDAPGTAVAWHLARRHPDVPAVVGVAAGRRALARAAEDGSPEATPPG